MNQINTGASADTEQLRAVGVFADILIVLLVSATIYLLEGLGISQGWLDVGPDARGASSVVAGALAAVAVVLWRGGNLASIGFRRPDSWLLPEPRSRFIE